MLKTHPKVLGVPFCCLNDSGFFTLAYPWVTWTRSQQLSDFVNSSVETQSYQLIYVCCVAASVRQGDVSYCNTAFITHSAEKVTLSGKVRHRFLNLLFNILIKILSHRHDF